MRSPVNAMGFGSFGLIFTLVVVLFISIQFNTSIASARRRSNKAGTLRVRPIVITDDSRRSNRLEEIEFNNNGGGNIESPPPTTTPTPIFKQWLELEIVPTAKTSVKLHSEVILECIAVGSPPPTIYWLKNDQPIESVMTFESAEELMNSVDNTNPIFRTLTTSHNKINGFSMSKIKSKLPIRCIRPEDEGKYTCVADNDGRELASNTIVVIEEDDRSLDWKPECEFRLPIQEFIGKKGRRGTPAYIHLSETLHMEAIGNDIILPCRSGGKPKPKSYWTNTEGQNVLVGKKFQINSSGDLVIKNLSWNEMGEYTCNVENPYGSESSGTFLYPLLVSSSHLSTLSQLLRFPLSKMPWMKHAHTNFTTPHFSQGSSSFGTP